MNGTVQKSLQTIPARQGKATKLQKGDKIKVINTHGTQVVDTWAFNAEDLGEVMSMEHSRSAYRKAIPAIGDALVTNKRRPILVLLEDTCGVHDTLMSSCDIYRYRGLDPKYEHEYHDSCTDNLHTGLKAIGTSVPACPSPFNLWMNVPVAQTPNFSLTFEPPASKPGDYVVLRAEMDCIVAFSACPQDILPINGTGKGNFAGQIYDCHFEVFPAEEA